MFKSPSVFGLTLSALVKMSGLFDTHLVLYLDFSVNSMAELAVC